MPAIELRQDEIGQYDPAAAKARRERLWGKPAAPRGGTFGVEQPKTAAIIPFSETHAVNVEGAARLYPVPVGPCRPDMAPRHSTLQVRAILTIVAHVHHVSVNDILSQRRMAEIVRPRQEAMWLARKYTQLSLPQIGRQIGGRDHTTILHAIRKLDRLIAEGSYAPVADAYITDWLAYLGERDALTPKAISATPTELPVEPEPRPVTRRRIVPLPDVIPAEPPAKSPPRYSTGLKWTDADIDRLTVLWAKGWSRYAIAAHMGRSWSSVRKAASRYGIAASAAIAAE